MKFTYRISFLCALAGCAVPSAPEPVDDLPIAKIAEPREEADYQGESSDNERAPVSVDVTEDVGGERFGFLAVSAREAFGGEEAFSVLARERARLLCNRRGHDAVVHFTTGQTRYVERGGRRLIHLTSGGTHGRLRWYHPAETCVADLGDPYPDCSGADDDFTWYNFHWFTEVVCQ